MAHITFFFLRSHPEVKVAQEKGSAHISIVKSPSFP
jgi:hypothetical protein